jgi:hypothetical protein
MSLDLTSFRLISLGLRKDKDHGLRWGLPTTDHWKCSTVTVYPQVVNKQTGLAISHQPTSLQHCKQIVTIARLHETKHNIMHIQISDPNSKQVHPTEQDHRLTRYIRATSLWFGWSVLDKQTNLPTFNFNSNELLRCFHSLPMCMESNTEQAIEWPLQRADRAHSCPQNRGTQIVTHFKAVIWPRWQVNAIVKQPHLVSKKQWISFLPCVWKASLNRSLNDTTVGRPSTLVSTKSRHTIATQLWPYKG